MYAQDTGNYVAKKNMLNNSAAYYSTLFIIITKQEFLLEKI